eukprot:CAMPEP_0206216138 /NCGR_PEP_ID=MMETSP0047_2-20121206/2563_1 /ASSEMBLY_ACC=CAM_ASM_000192 /TAXON_ID=195065 /ORGANISM="Chroomonas mesostigmatica_cf, Strain CCMP1168" /LENGTH=196 /DNA_ID=CAMNT_0053638469 /DNA_START=156 /DNA_END=742 /DNA_ORIENTATION=+
MVLPQVLTPLKDSESTATPMACIPESTCMHSPVIPAPSGEQRARAAPATCSAVTALASGEFAFVYSIALSMNPCPSSDLPMADAARDLKGPAEIAFTRTPHFRPASHASIRVSDSSCAFALDMPPPYPGTTPRDAAYVREIAEDPLGMKGPKFCISATMEYDEADETRPQSTKTSCATERTSKLTSRSVYFLLART